MYYILFVFFCSVMMNMVFSINNPIALMIMVVSQVLFSTILMGLVMESSWMAFILLMIFVSGLMVVFTYMAALAANELVMTPDLTAAPKLILIFMVQSLILMPSVMYFKGLKKTGLNLDLSHMEVAVQAYSKNFWPTPLLIMYLLLTLVMVVYNINIWRAPLRSI